MDTFETIVYFASCFSCTALGLWLGIVAQRKYDDAIHQDCDTEFPLPNSTDYFVKTSPAST